MYAVKWSFFQNYKNNFLPTHWTLKLLWDTALEKNLIEEILNNISSTTQVNIEHQEEIAFLLLTNPVVLLL